VVQGAIMAGLTISMSELRRNFDEYLRRVKLGETFLITKYGKPVGEFKPAGPIQERQKYTLDEQLKQKYK
jgi:antitoxin (DNA-binding transcriptional repressor) of toxin-antitoxin stability system